MSDGIRFGTDGWRAPIAEGFTFDNVRRVTAAIASYLDRTYDRKRPVLVGYDTRFLADRFARTAAEILSASGRPVLLADRDCPTPAIAYTARQLETAGALTFTASHNPPPDCGLKYIPDYAGPATADITNAIVEELDQIEDVAGGQQVDSTFGVSGTIGSFDPKPIYLPALYEQIDCTRLRQSGLTFVYDALYSTSRGYLDTALRHCHCQVEVLHDRRDVLFGGGMPEPKPQFLQTLRDRVRHSDADLGMATDGDGDRFGVIDETGAWVSPNIVMMLLLRHLVEYRGLSGAVVRTVGTTHLLDRLAEQYNLPLYETAVGFKHIGQLMRELPVLIGGEESGGLSVLGHIPEKDGILANLLVAEAIACAQKPLSQLAAEAIAAAGGPTLNHRLDLRLTETHKKIAIEHYKTMPPSEIANVAVKRTSQKDGIKLYLANGDWVLIRPSGTEPLLRVSMETASLERQKAIAADMRKQVLALNPETSGDAKQ